MLDTQLLSAVVADQAEAFASKQLGIARELDHQTYLSTKQIVVISGVRRSGKSTLLRQFSQELGPCHFITFDDERLLDFSVADFQSLLLVFKKRHQGTTILIDEVQTVPGWERFARRLHDEGYKVFITGSNAKLLSSELATHLTGRYLKIELFPFSFREFLLARTLPARPVTTADQAAVSVAFDDYMEQGGFPEMTTSPTSELLLQLYEDILYKDLIVRFKIRDVKLFRQLAQFLFTNIGSPISYHGLAKTLAARSAVSIKRYLTFLSEAYLIGEIYKYDWSLKKQFVSNKKVYVIDLGMRSRVGFSWSEDRGRKLENIVYLELRRRRKEVFYFKDTRECDFVVREGQRVTEVLQVTETLSASNEAREAEGLIQALERCQASFGIIITRDQRRNLTHAGQQINVIPITDWLLGS